MYILQSIVNNAVSFASVNWQTETLPLPLRKAEKVLAQRKLKGGSRRYRLVKS